MRIDHSSLLTESPNYHSSHVTDNDSHVMVAPGDVTDDAWGSHA